MASRVAPRIKLISSVLALFLLHGCGGSSGSSSGNVGSSRLDNTPAPTDAAAEITWLNQNAHAFGSTSPEATDYGDLQSFGDAIGDARIVSLGEETHGSATTYNMKTRLVKYLHEKKGFDVLIIESNFFSGNRIWQLAQSGQKVDDIAPDNIFYMYSKSAEGRQVLQYVDSQRTTADPLVLTAADSANLGVKYSNTDLFPMLESFLGSRGSASLASSGWPTYKDLALNALFAYPPTTTNPPESKTDAFYAVSDSLEAELCGAQPDTFVFPDSSGFWCRVVKNTRSQANRTFDTSGVSTRDIESAANAQWLIDHPYAGHKIIFWGHTIHVGRYDTSILPSPSMGSELARIYGNQMYVVNFTTSGGKDLNYFDLSTYDVTPDLPGSVEDILSRLNEPLLFVDTRNTNPPASLASLTARNLDFTYYDGFLNSLGTTYDGLFYWETNEPATMDR